MAEQISFMPGSEFDRFTSYYDDKTNYKDFDKRTMNAILTIECVIIIGNNPKGVVISKILLLQSFMH